MAPIQRRAALGLALWVALVSDACAMYEDQAGTYDWYKAYLGHVVHAQLHKTKPRLYLGSEQGVVAALNLRDGSVAFRTKLELPGAATTRLLEAPGVLVSLVGSSLQAWDQNDGALKWGVELPGPAQRSQDAAFALAQGGDAATIAVLSARHLLVFNAATGEKVSTLDLGDEAAEGSLGLVRASGSAFTAFTWAPGSSTVHFASSESGSGGALTSPQPLSSLGAASGVGVAVLSADLQQLCTAGAEAGASLLCTPLAELGVPTGTTVQLVGTSTGWALASGDPAHPGAALVKRLGGGLEAPFRSDGTSAVSEPFAAAAGEHVAFISIKPADGTVGLQYVSTTGGAVTASEGPVHGARSDRLAPGVVAPGVRAAAMGSYKKRDQSEGFRVLLVWQDERISLLQQGVMVWSRDEALGGVALAAFSDLPPAKLAASALSHEEDGTAAAAAAAVPGKFSDELSQFVHLQVLSAKVQFKLASGEEVAELAQLREQLSDKHLPFRDSRGFRRSIVVATRSGKVAALHNGDGHMLWSRPGPPARRGADLAAQHLLYWRRYHDLTHAPQLAVLEAAAGAGGRAALSVLDAYTGKRLAQQDLPFAVSKLLSLGTVPDGEHAEQHVYLVVELSAAEAAPVVHVLPDSSVARAYVAQRYRSLYFFLDIAAAPVGKAAPALRGFGFTVAEAKQLKAQGSATAVQVWSLSFPQPVLAWAAFDPTQPVHTSVKVLGDRSMKYRYLNPNTFVVVTGAVPGAPAGDEVEVNGATIYIVDSVTGQVHHVQTAPGTRGPAAVLISDNSVLVNLWDASNARFVFVSLELYDASARTFSVLDHMFNPNSTQPQSSFNLPPLEVLSASYFTRLPTKALAVTRTRAGINSKLILQLTHTDQVYALDQRLVDPRRPRKTKLTPEEQEERLVPYYDTLPMSPTQFVSYNKQVLGLQTVLTEPSRLESTSLVFAYGVDLQYTRVAPAKGFDSLDDDFSYGLLVVALVGLSVASAFMHFFTKKSMLKAKWQ